MVQIEYWDGVELLARLIAIHDPELGTLKQFKDPDFFHKVLNRIGMGTREGWYKIATNAFEENPTGLVVGYKKERDSEGKLVKKDVHAPKHASLLYEFSNAIKFRKPLVFHPDKIEDFEKAANYTVPKKRFEKWMPRKTTKLYLDSQWDLYTLYKDADNETRVSKHTLNLKGFGKASMHRGTIERTKNLNPAFTPYVIDTNYLGYFEVDQDDENFVDIRLQSERYEQKKISIRLHVGVGLPVFCYGHFQLTKPDYKGKCAAIRTYPANDNEAIAFDAQMKQTFYAEGRILEALDSLNIFTLPSPITKFDQI